MIERLNRETGPDHAEAEHDVDALFAADVTLDAYRGYLVRCYGFEAPLEAALALSTSLDRMLDLRRRARSGLLAHDLMRLGLRPQAVAELPLCLAVPQFRGNAEALGWMYVVERATLSHALLRRHLLTRVPEVASASSYLQAAGGTLGTRWGQFGEVLDEVAQHPAIADRIVSSAIDAFRHHRRWTQHDPAPYHLYSVRAVG